MFRYLVVSNKSHMIHTFFYPKYYTVSIDDQTGRVRIFSNSKLSKGREMAQFLNPSGYLRSHLNKIGVQIHTLVAKYFLGERPNGLVVNHIDGNKLNNKPSNLEYVTIAENIHHSIKMGLHVSCRPEEMPKYIDGRTKDITKYKNEWYLKNRLRILEKAKQRYLESKRQNVYSLTAR